MNIEISGLIRKKYTELVRFVANETNKIMKQPDTLSVSFAFVSKCKIKKLNKKMRGVDRVTDVLSFPSLIISAGEKINLESDEVIFLQEENGCFHLGDIAICLTRIKKQAKEYHVSTIQELKKIVIHSMLHLMGYDHIKDSDYEIMHKKEILLDKKIEVKG